MNTSSPTVEVATSSLPTPRLFTIAILAMGGEGGGVLSDWIVDIAENAGYFAQTTSVPGVAQRTGATIYYLEIFPRILSKASGKPPVLALMPVPGEIDVVIASELMEAGRAIDRGLVTRDRTTLVASTHRVYSMNERTAMADGRADSEAFLNAAHSCARMFHRADFARIALDAGSVISAALLGGLAATGALPFDQSQFVEAIRRGGVGVEGSLKAFAAGYEAIAAPSEAASEAPAALTVGPLLQPLAHRVLETFPPSTHAILIPAIRRLTEYQDLRYATEYVDRLELVRDLDKRWGDGNFKLLTETARYMALWLTYEDAIRVADLKTREARFERVDRDTRRSPSQLLQIHEFLSPQPQEIADLLPVVLGRWLLNSNTMKSLILRFTGGGKVIRSSSMSGFLLLYLISLLRPLRRLSLRFYVENDAVTRWLDTIVAVAPVNYWLACEIAECAQLIKGYSDTHALGTRNFHKLMERVPELQFQSEGAAELKRLRAAALSDDTGKTLSQSLVQITL